MRTHASDNRELRKSRFSLGTAIVALAAVMLLSTAHAQYAYDPSAADEQQPGIRFFGSAKDSNGVLVPGATILLSSDQASYVFVTDDMGRFHGNLPPATVSDKVAAKCWKAGFRMLTVTKRRGPAGVKPTVQVDCVLRATTVASN
jgi:hypothetical protein